LARFWTPLYATSEIAARIPITTITMSSSMIVKPESERAKGSALDGRELTRDWCG
jgi:hypothetical protein